MSRKIVQITTNQDPGEVGELFALCDDGTVWVLSSPAHGRVTEQWIQIPNVPQGADSDGSVETKSRLRSAGSNRKSRARPAEARR